MKIIIVEEMWGVNSRIGKYSTRRTDKKVINSKTDQEVFFENGRRKFIIENVNDAKVTISVFCKNERAEKTWTLSKKDRYFYRPKSFDAGYQYIIYVK